MDALIAWGIVVTVLFLLWLADVALEERARRQDEEAQREREAVRRTALRVVRELDVHEEGR